ncbi:MAG: symmetrical bis(5'-nucleosyl)-tetraphosphatase [Rhodocyclaceae bacterium]|nr:symmetrical bis(5'-nucleosyl)-tetraphosphatase [Rhodocyclaceae bacterium]
MATYAIGDVQGCFDELTALLEHIDFDKKLDRLWFVGDLVNRGPKSLEVLRFVYSLGELATVVLGNHDLHLVMRSEGFGKANREDTFAEILAAPDRNELLQWLRSRPLFHYEGDWAMVHAGLLPEWSVAQAKQLSDEVSSALVAPDYVEFLSKMWGSEPSAWSDKLSGWERLRVIVNAMTRMRYLTQSGAMELRAPGNKAAPYAGPTDCRPWFDAGIRASAGTRIVCGHWSTLGLLDRPNVLAIDTGCLWGGALTAVRLDDRRIFCQPCSGHAAPRGGD